MLQFKFLSNLSGPFPYQEPFWNMATEAFKKQEEKGPIETPGDYEKLALSCVFAFLSMVGL